MNGAWADIIREQIDRAGSKARFARQVGVSTNTVQRWLSGEIEKPDVDALRRVAAHSRYSLPYLIAIANGVALEEMAAGAGRDLLGHDIALAEEERAHMRDQYVMLMRSTMMARAVADAVTDYERTVGPLDADSEVDVEVVDGQVTVHIRTGAGRLHRHEITAEEGRCD